MNTFLNLSNIALEELLWNGLRILTELCSDPLPVIIEILMVCTELERCQTATQSRISRVNPKKTLVLTQDQCQICLFEGGCIALVTNLLGRRFSSKDSTKCVNSLWLVQCSLLLLSIVVVPFAEVQDARAGTVKAFTLILEYWCLSSTWA